MPPGDGTVRTVCFLCKVESTRHREVESRRPGSGGAKGQTRRWPPWGRAIALLLPGGARGLLGKARWTSEGSARTWGEWEHISTVREKQGGSETPRLRRLGKGCRERGRPSVAPKRLSPSPPAPGTSHPTPLHKPGRTHTSGQVRTSDRNFYQESRRKPFCQQPPAKTSLPRLQGPRPEKGPRWEKIASFLMPGAAIPSLRPC